MLFMILYDDFPAKVQLFIKNCKSFLIFQRICCCFSRRNTRKRPASNIGRRALFVRLPRQPPFTNNQSFILTTLRNMWFPYLGGCYPISIWRSTFVRACSVFGRSTVSTPCSTRAAIFAFSTSSGRMSVCSNLV